MYIYHALINVLGAHMIHINLKFNMIFYTHFIYILTGEVKLKLAGSFWGSNSVHFCA